MESGRSLVGSGLSYLNQSQRELNHYRANLWNYIKNEINLVYQAEICCEQYDILTALFDINKEILRKIHLKKLYNK